MGYGAIQYIYTEKKNYTNMKLNLSHEILIDVVTMKSELYNLDRNYGVNQPSHCSVSSRSVLASV